MTLYNSDIVKRNYNLSHCINNSGYNFKEEKEIGATNFNIYLRYNNIIISLLCKIYFIKYIKNNVCYLYPPCMLTCGLA